MCKNGRLLRYLLTAERRRVDPFLFLSLLAQNRSPITPMKISCVAAWLGLFLLSLRWRRQRAACPSLALKLYFSRLKVTWCTLKKNILLQFSQTLVKNRASSGSNGLAAKPEKSNHRRLTATPFVGSPIFSTDSYRG